jgi:membrane-bound lytic murein transglycosylase D
MQRSVVQSFSVIVLLAGCATQRVVTTPIGEPSPEYRAPSQVASNVDPSIDQEILSVDDGLEHNGVRALPKVPIEINHKVQEWLRYFSKDKSRFQRYMDRGEVYRPLIENVLRKSGVPTEFYYLAMIESGFMVHASSHASAVGIWQFIPGTAHRFGLKKTSDLDERRDVVRATAAAAVYLKNLHAAFQSWYLAMAGYNAGEGRILRTVVNGGSRDFWELVERKALPAETRDYVPKFLAALLIGRNPEKFGFRRPRAEAFPSVEAALVPPRVPLHEIARHSGVSLATLKLLNPHLIRGRSPNQSSSYAIWVPKGHALPTVDARQKMEASATMTVRAPSTKSFAKAREPNYHRVKRGETLGSISARYKTNVAALRRINRLRGTKVWVGQRLRLADNGRSHSISRDAYLR